MKKLSNKSGVTLASLVIYVILFTVFTIVTLSVTSNLNKNIFDSRADIENNKNLDKTIVYMLESSKNSKLVSQIGNKIVFSNNDEYEYNVKAKALYLNNKKVVKNIHKFITNVKDDTIYIDITFEKYGIILNKELKFTVRGDIL